jgi:hypothetical protein
VAWHARWCRARSRALGAHGAGGVTWRGRGQRAASAGAARLRAPGAGRAASGGCRRVGRAWRGPARGRGNKLRGRCWWLLLRAGKGEAESRREVAEWERGGNLGGGGGVEEEGRGLFPMAAAAKG